MYMDKKRYEYLVGKRIELTYMDDPYPVPSGTKGTVTYVDDVCNIHVNWDNGRTLSLVPDVDRFNVL